MDEVIVIEILEQPIDVGIPVGEPICIEVGIPGPPGTPGVGIPLANFRAGVPLDGVMDGTNRLFTLPGGETAIDLTPNLGSATIDLTINGSRLMHGAGNDYTIIETGGPATGFNAVVIEAGRPAPLPGDNILANWIIS